MQERSLPHPNSPPDGEGTNRPELPSPFRGRVGDGVKKILIILLTVTLTVTACTTGTPSNTAATSTPIPTALVAARPTYVVQRGTVSDIFSFSGRWQPRDQMNLSFEIAGTVRQVNVQRGQAVLQGQLLADYQIDTLENQLASAELQLESTLADQANQTTTTVQSVEDAEIALANAHLSLQSTLDNRPWTNVASASNGIESAHQSLEEAQRSYLDSLSRPDQPASSVDSALNQVTSAQTGLDNAEISYLSSAQSYNNYEYQIQQAQNEVIRAELTLERARQNQATAISDEAVRSVQLEIDQIKAQIAQSSLYAPFDGVVLQIDIQPGDQVNAYAVVMVLALPEPKEVIASLSFGDISRLSIGMIGKCQVANQPETAVGCLIRRMPTSSTDVDQSVRITASLDGTLEGQLVEVEMPLEVAENVLWLPPEAIRTFQNRTFVVLDTPDGPRTVDIVLGLQTDDRIEITSGVNEGDVVIAP